MNCCNFKLNDFTLADVFSRLKTNLDKLQNLFKIAYDDDPKYKIKSIIKNAVIDQYSDGKIVKEMIEGYFAIPEDRLTKEILELIKEEK